MRGIRVGSLPAIAIGVSSLACEAQTRAPTDAELHAAYCIGVTQSLGRAFESLAPTVSASSATDPAILTKFNSDRAKLTQRLSRLQAYLVPKVPYIDTAALAAAYARADRDAQTIKDEVNQEFAACAARAPASDNVDRLKCLSNQPETETARRMTACSETTWLPF